MNEDMLILSERVKNTIQLGESHFREFKSALEGKENHKTPRQVSKICSDIGEALVAFANADGGELLVGIEDDGSITGVPHKEDDIALMLNSYISHVHQDSLLPMIAASKIIIDDKMLLFFSVSKGASEIYQLPDGRCVRRKDKSTSPENIKKIQFDRQESKSREFDRNFVDGASVADLDLVSARNFADNLMRGLSVERYLQQIGVAEYSSTGLRLRMAALLLFAKEINRWHPGSQVRILEVAGTQVKSGESFNIKKEKVVTGNIFDLMYKSWEELRFSLASKTEFGPDARFAQKYIYPEFACREALVNAIAHRDYNIYTGIEIYLFDDRMEIKNPGSLLSSLTMNDIISLQGAHESRNSLVARVLRENKFMRELGEGMKRMFESMEASELQRPLLNSDSTSFSVTLFKKSVFTEQQEHWLSVFRRFNLSSLQKKIVVCGMDNREISQQDIYKAMSTNDLSIYMKEVSGLRNSGILDEINTNMQAANISKRDKIDKSLVPRFRVQVPNPTEIPEASLTVFVRNLPARISQDIIRTHFEKCGKVKKVHVHIPNNVSPSHQYTYGFVTFYEPEATEKAIREIDGTVINGRTIEVRRFIPKISLGNPN